MSLSLTIYLILLIGVSLQRLQELRIAGRNTDLLVRLGAEEVAPGHYTAMRILHGAWLFCCVIEAFLREIPPSIWVIALGMCGLFIGQMLRISAMRSLGPRWTTRILVLPDSPPVTGGVYRWLRHPNYIGVILEIAALPLIYGGAVTAVFFTFANLVLLLCVRIPAEEAALVRVNNYATYLDGQGRLVSQRSNR